VTDRSDDETGQDDGRTGPTGVPGPEDRHGYQERAEHIDKRAKAAKEGV
jgi:hypothetical protein